MGDNYHYQNSWNCNNCRESYREKEANNWYKKRKRRLRAITLQGVVEKSLIFLSQYWKKENFIAAHNY